MVVSLNYCSQNGGNLYRAPYYNRNPNIGPRIIGNLDQSPHVFGVPNQSGFFVTVCFNSFLHQMFILCQAKKFFATKPFSRTKSPVRTSSLISLISFPFLGVHPLQALIKLSQDFLNPGIDAREAQIQSERYLFPIMVILG